MPKTSGALKPCWFLVIVLLSSGAATGGDLPQRVPWTSSRVHGTPDPPPPFRTEPAFPGLKFVTPTEITGVPGFDQLIVAEEKSGRIYAFRNDAKVASADLLIEIGESVFGVACHPQFAKNGYMYVVHLRERARVLQVSRFFVRPGERWVCEPASQVSIFRWPVAKAGVHMGGALRFGPDGYLYIGVGDGDRGSDSIETGQDIRDVLGSILRVDVDHGPKYKRYGVPRDNPFVHSAGARPEIWAYGVRQPWKMSFDRLNGDLWVGDVGQDRLESILRVERGGNYGWSILEGGQPFRPDRRRGPTPILPPVAVQPHSEFRSITGGHVYRGRRFQDLVGTYVHGDYETGKIWGLRLDGSRVRAHRELAASRLRIVAFAEDQAGELLVLDHLEGTIHRLAAGAAAPQNLAFPRQLSATGLFASVKDHQPAAGLIPYSVNAPLWSDHASKDRLLALPGQTRINFDAVANRLFVEAPRGWDFPDGAVLVKTFALEMEPGNPASRRRIETRLLHLQKLADTDNIRDQLWRGYSYVWNDDQSDADLVEAAGLDRPYTIRDSQAPGGVREQIWHFPSRAECTMCHSVSAKFILGVNTLQMNRDIDVAGKRVNQLEHLEQLGVFSAPLPARPGQLPRLVDYEDERLELDARARSYLHANCAHCHILFGGGNSPFQLQANLPLPVTRILDAVPSHGDLGLPGARLLAPGKPESSLIHWRMATPAAGRMPPLASAIVDDQGAQLIADWIRQVRPEPAPYTSEAWLVGAVTVVGGGLVGAAVWRRSRRRQAQT